jgi:mercuric ion binding protein
MMKIWTVACAALLWATPALAAEETVTLSVPGMDCVLCAPTVRASLARVPGVTRVELSTEQRMARVTFDNGRTSIGALTAATRNAGYPSTAAPQ